MNDEPKVWIGQTKNGGDTHPAPQLIEFIKAHPAIVATILYLQLTFIGAFFSWTLFNEFGVDVFDFIEANDLLLIGFKELSMFASLPITLLIVFLASRFTSKRRIRVYWGCVIGAMLALTFMAPYVSGKAAAHRIRSSKVSLVTLRLRGSESVPDGGISLIGVTERFAFFYVHGQETTFIAPVASIASIQTRAKAPASETPNKSKNP